MLSELLLHFSSTFLRHWSLSVLSTSYFCRHVNILISYTLLSRKWTLTESITGRFIDTMVDIDISLDQTLIISHLCFILTCIHLSASHSSLSTFFFSLKILSRAICTGTSLPNMIWCYPKSSKFTLGSLPLPALSPIPSLIYTGSGSLAILNMPCPF